MNVMQFGCTFNEGKSDNSVRNLKFRYSDQLLNICQTFIGQKKI